jgi:hypothetical protein
MITSVTFLADGTLIAMTGPQTLWKHVTPAASGDPEFVPLPGTDMLQAADSFGRWLPDDGHGNLYYVGADKADGYWKTEYVYRLASDGKLSVYLQEPFAPKQGDYIFGVPHSFINAIAVDANGRVITSVQAVQQQVPDDQVQGTIAAFDPATMTWTDAPWPEGCRPQEDNSFNNAAPVVDGTVFFSTRFNPCKIAAGSVTAEPLDIGPANDAGCVHFGVLSASAAGDVFFLAASDVDGFSIVYRLPHGGTQLEVKARRSKGYAQLINAVVDVDGTTYMAARTGYDASAIGDLLRAGPGEQEAVRVHDLPSRISPVAVHNEPVFSYVDNQLFELR